MGWFFDPWLRTASVPDFTISGIGYSGTTVTGRVDFKGTPYRVKTEVFAEMVDGTTSHVDVVLNPDRREGVSEFSFTLPKKPRLLSFDPYDRILRNHGPEPQNRLQARIGRMQAVVDSQKREYAATFADFNSRIELEVPTDPNGKFLIGHPDSMPLLRDLCRRVGFTVAGNKLTYDGTTIDLTQGAALALIDLGEGKSCAIGLGVTELTPQLGISKVCLVDKYGRFQRGKTEARKEGPLVFRVP
jgi:hypothetical protein